MCVFVDEIYFFIILFTITQMSFWTVLNFWNFKLLNSVDSHFNRIDAFIRNNCGEPRVLIQLVCFNLCSNLFFKSQCDWSSSVQDNHWFTTDSALQESLMMKVVVLLPVYEDWMTLAFPPKAWLPGLGDDLLLLMWIISRKSVGWQW